jgi:hypothetical protein
VVLLALIAVSACGPSSSTTQGAQTTVDRATFVEHTRCRAEDDEKNLAPVLSGDAVQGVQPLYTTIEGAKSGVGSELRGVTVTIRPLPGMTAEWLDRELECHSARATLGHGHAAPDDPFFLPTSFVNIEVRSATDGFDAEVVGYSPAEAAAILARANAFAKGKVAAAQQSKASGASH